MTVRARIVREKPYYMDATPVEMIRVYCKMCGMHVTVPVVREFVHVLRRLCAFAGVRLSNDLPVVAHRCARGHLVTVSLDELRVVA